MTLAGTGVRVKKLGPVPVKIYAAGVYLDKKAVASRCKILGTLSSVGQLEKNSNFDKEVRV